MSHAHPFREAFYIDTVRLYPDYVDAVEVINSSHLDPKFDERALAYAKKHNLPMTAGSDSHHLDSLPGGGMEFYERLNSIEDFVRAVKDQAYILIET